MNYEKTINDMNTALKRLQDSGDHAEDVATIAEGLKLFEKLYTKYSVVVQRPDGSLSPAVFGYEKGVQDAYEKQIEMVNSGERTAPVGSPQVRMVTEWSDL